MRISSWVDAMIADGIERGASDIHFEPLEHALRVRYRIHGSLWEVASQDKEHASAVVIRIKSMAKLDIAEQRLPQDGSCRFPTLAGMYDLRVSTMPVLYGEKIVLRILGNAWQDQRLAELGLTADQLQTLEDALQRSYGLVVSGGATGTGKSTTLYAGLKELNDSRRNIIAIEDPVEYRLAGINQMHVNEKIGLTFAKGLRAILRQDPDVIMIGEIRDRETAEIAVRAALTGHLVLATIHVNRAADIPLRFLEMGIPSYLLAASLSLVMSQRLLRILCPACKQPVRQEASIAGLQGELYERRGCPQCGQTGYMGRKAIFEVLAIDKVAQEILAKEVQWGSWYGYCRERMRENLSQRWRAYWERGEVDWREIWQLEDLTES